MFGKMLKGLGAVSLVLIFIGYLSETGSQNTMRSVIPDAGKGEPASDSTSQTAPTIAIQDVLNAPRDAPPVTLPARDTNGYRAKCEEDWTKRGVLDQSMANYCETQENEGYDKLVALAHKFSGYRWLQAVIDGALAHWTKRGARDDSEAAYIVDLETDHFLTLQYMAHQNGFNAAAATSCLEQWTKNGDPDWNQTVYCYKTDTGN